MDLLHPYRVSVEWLKTEQERSLWHLLLCIICRIISVKVLSKLQYSVGLTTLSFIELCLDFGSQHRIHPYQKVYYDSDKTSSIASAHCQVFAQVLKWNFCCFLALLHSFLFCPHVLELNDPCFKILCWNAIWMQYIVPMLGSTILLSGSLGKACSQIHVLWLSSPSMGGFLSHWLLGRMCVMLPHPSSTNTEESKGCLGGVPFLIISLTHMHALSASEELKTQRPKTSYRNQLMCWKKLQPPGAGDLHTWLFRNNDDTTLTRANKQNTSEGGLATML